MNDTIAIEIKNVKKQYRLGQIGGGTLQGDLQSWWARKRGKEDPNIIIGSDQRLIGQTFMALNGINLTIHKGEAVGIIGKNGAGKSTLLKLLSRVTAPTEGTIDIFGRITSMLEVGTGFHGEMTGRENVYMNGAILGMTKSEIDAKMDQIIEFSEVGDFIDTPVKRYSSGMYVKLAFSVAAHLDSEIMIMDEVLAVGDMAFQQKCLNKMSDATKTEGKTVLYVSHNMNTIRKLCTRCIVMDEGKVIFDGDVEEGISKYINKSAETNTSVDLNNGVREFAVPTRRVWALHARIHNKEDNIFLNDEDMEIAISWKNLMDVFNLGFRIEIWALDNSRVGSFILPSIVKNGNAGEVYEMTMVVPLSQIRESEYRTVFVFFTNDTNGENYDVDIVQGLDFKKERSDYENRLVWRPKSWGYIELPSPELKTIQKLEGE